MIGFRRKQSKKFMLLVVTMPMNLEPLRTTHNLSSLRIIVYYELRLTIIRSFQKYEFTRVTPISHEIFTDVVMGVADSGSNELFPPPKRGRPSKADKKKRKREDFDVEYIPTNVSSQKRNLRRRGPKRLKTGKGPIVDPSSSDTNKVLNMADILLQARDLKTGHWKVFVEWDDRPLKEASWTPLTYLSKESTQWWG